MGKTKGGFYAVAKGRNVGIFATWDECKAQVDGFQSARFKKFDTRLDAEKFIEANSGKISVFPPATAIPTIFTSPSSVPNTESTTIPGLSTRFKFSHPKDSRPSQRSTLLVPATSTEGVKRKFSTSAVLGKRSLKVKEDRVTGQKRLKIEANIGVDLSKFQVDEEGYVVVFTDGACSDNGKYGAKAGIGVWFGDDHFLNVSEPVIGRQTNNTAEIQAAERAILEAKNVGITKLKLKTDSQFTINCITLWLQKWKHNGWKSSTGQFVKNKEDLIKLDAAMEGIEIKWSYVAGHQGHHGNEMADRLAVAGANSIK